MAYGPDSAELRFIAIHAIFRVRKCLCAARSRQCGAIDPFRRAPL